MRALRLVLHVQAYKWARLVAGAEAATVNRELVALFRAASLAKHQHGLGGRVAPWAFCRLNGAPVGDFKRSVFQCYAIVEEGIRQEAAAYLTQGAKSKVARSRGKVVGLAR